MIWHKTMKLPSFLEKAIIENKTSLGNHPAFPPEDEDLFVSRIIKHTYDAVMRGVGTNNKKILFTRLNELITECKKEEASCKEALEQLCSNVLSNIFEIPTDTINITGKLVNECDMSKFRMVPESTPDFEFDDIDDMHHMSEMIYQRRMINCLIAGIALDYAYNFDLYIKQINSINPNLINLYQEINKYNLALLYNTYDTINSVKHSNSGSVSVMIGDEEERVSIDACGVIFPILLEYTIRGILEIASLKGLPEDQGRTEYITGKADYRLAENWDMRMGIPLWKLYKDCIDKTGFTANTIEPNFIIMELSLLDSDIFNDYLQNVFQRTKKGIELTDGLLNMIKSKKDKDIFTNYIDSQNTKFTINDSDTYTSDELLN